MPRHNPALVAARAAGLLRYHSDKRKGAKLIAVEAIDFSAPGWAHLRGGAGNLAKVAA